MSGEPIFENGALSAAFAYLYNELGDRISDPDNVCSSPPACDNDGVAYILGDVVFSLADAGNGPVPETMALWLSIRKGAKGRVKVVDRDGDVVELAAQGKNGNISVITQMNKQGDQLILRGTHIDGGGKGTSSLSELKDLARDLGRQQGVKEVIVHGGKRTTGANPGKTPRPITIKVD